MAGPFDIAAHFTPSFLDFLSDDDDVLFPPITRKIDIKLLGLALSGVLPDRPRSIGNGDEGIPRYTMDDFRAMFRVGREGDV